MKGMFRAILLCSGFFLFVKESIGQEYILEGKNRLNFANTYLETGGLYSPSFLSKGLEGNTMKEFSNSASFMPYLNIGGIHFWGHVDFFISVPLGEMTLQQNAGKDFHLSQSVATGARVLPWAYQDGQVRPYVGVNWAIQNFKQTSIPDRENPLFQKSKLMFDAGMLYGKGNFITRLGVNVYPSNQWRYPLSETIFQEIETPRLGAYLSLMYAFETTRSKNMEKENARMNRYPHVTKPTKDAIKFGDAFWGIGLASSFMLSTSAYNESTYPYFNKRPISRGFLDAALGYHFNRSGIVTAVSFRNPKFVNEAFGVKQTLQKSSVAWEAYKYLTDYNGFTPYLGLNMAYEHLNYSETSSSKNYQHRYHQLNPGLTFGWDILPGKTEQFFVLRTNLRWQPFSSITVDGKRFSQNQIEYNVIQAVFYPKRFKNAKNKNDQ